MSNRIVVNALEVGGAVALGYGLYRISLTLMLIVLGAALLGVAIAIEMGSGGVPRRRAR